MRLTKLLVNLFLSTVLLTNPLIAQHSPKQTNSDQGATSLKPKALDQVCCSNAQLVVQRALPNLRTIRPTLEPGELAIIDYRLGRALLPAEKELGIEYLRSALASASIAPERNVPMEADSAPSSEAKRLQLFYNEQLRRQETVQNAVLAEMTKVDFAAAVEQIAKLTPSRKGYQKLKFGDTVLAFPPERNTNTHLICIVSQSLSSTDPNGAANFFSEHSYRLNEPVFLPAFHLYDKLSEKNEIAADQVKGAIKERVIHLLEHGDRGTVIVTHFTLSRSLAEAHSASLVKEIAELSLAHIGENFGNDFSIPLQRELARAFHQYSATLYRWGKDTQLAVEFQHHRNRMLQKIGISPDEFEKSE